jgi:hypothetical protein
MFGSNTVSDLSFLTRPYDISCKPFFLDYIPKDVIGIGGTNTRQVSRTLEVNLVAFSPSCGVSHVHGSVCIRWLRHITGGQASKKRRWWRQGELLIMITMIGGALIDLNSMQKELATSKTSGIQQLQYLINLKWWGWCRYRVSIFNLSSCAFKLSCAPYSLVSPTALLVTQIPATAASTTLHTRLATWIQLTTMGSTNLRLSSSVCSSNVLTILSNGEFVRTTSTLK